IGKILSVNASKGTLSIRLLGYKPISKTFDAAINSSISIRLEEASSELEEVTIISNGYQRVDKSKATGSYATIDSTLLNRSVSANILDRLDGVTSGLIFNRSKTQGNQSDLNIRSRSTINGEDKPLVILDNFPYEGNINNINPNDIKDITVLKDAAAASIWGTRAGNGVIVITTYKGSYNASQQINLSTNFTLADQPNLHQVPWFSPEEWIGIEKFLYDKGAYSSTISSIHSPISSAVEIFEQRRKGLISQADSLSMIGQLKTGDIRKEMMQYLYRPSFNQQYALNISGGSPTSQYFVSAGYDQNQSTKITDSYRRTTLTSNHSFKALSNRLEISAGINFATSNTLSGIDSYASLSPYDRLVGEDAEDAVEAFDHFAGDGIGDVAGVPDDLFDALAGFRGDARAAEGGAV
ncbi:MAG: hypothetical protein EOO38_05895, partial [Cytophagaceae bacterium]